MAARKKTPARKANAPKKTAAKKPKAAKRPAMKRAAPPQKRRAPKPSRTKASRPKPSATKAAIPANPLAKRMAAFSEQVIKEEEAPIAVRTFNEARSGIEKSKELDVRTGSVKPVGDAVDEPEPDLE